MPELVAQRLVLAKDGEHEHIGLVGYHSPHIASREPIMVDHGRILAKQALGESFWVSFNGERLELKEGECPVCGLRPYLRTSADSGDAEKLRELPPG